MKYFVFILMVYSISSFAQNKKLYYLDTGNTKITAEEFKSIKDYKYNIDKTIKNDTAVIVKLYDRSAYGTLTIDELSQIKTILQDITKQIITKEKSIIINYFFKKQSCLNSYKRDKEYLKRIKEDTLISQYFITEKGYTTKSKKVDIYEDKKSLISSLFFPVEFNCGNYLIIKPDGSYLKYYGEHPRQDILTKLYLEWPKIDN